MKGKIATRVEFFTLAALILAAVLTVPAGPASAQTIIDEWNTVKAPPPPELKAAKIDPKVTALLVLDIQKQNCNNERRPRCVASVPRLQKLVEEARAKGVAIIYSLAGQATPADILKEVAPQGGEPVVKSSVDKFMGTDLENILKQKGIKTVIVVGTAAHGAVLSTGAGAVLRGLQVIVPIDGMSAESTYIEQYVTHHFATSPGTRRVVLTRIDMIHY
jgi:nicotinamidase-related amidase